MKRQENKVVKVIRKIVVIFLIFITVLYLTTNIIPHIRSYRNKNSISNIVRNNLGLLNNSIKDNSYNDALEIEGIKDIHFFETHEGSTYIDYFYSGFGIAPSGVYYGFYYHSIDEPIGYQGVNDKLTKDEQGWAWQEPHGDNWYYTEKIEDHWYYYEFGF